MTDPSNRTFVCSVVFLDIVEYSKRSVTEQLKLKQRFNEALSHALQRVAPVDRVVLDTGDGAAISFLGNPDDSLFVAMNLRDAIAAEDPKESPPLLVRIGVNLGPVRLIKDINGQLNIIGDGINVAQRVMSFAEPGKILVSRSYYEVISRLSDDYDRFFHYEGTRTDKHVREHAVYAVSAPIREIPAPLAAKSEQDEAAAWGDVPGTSPSGNGFKAFADRLGIRPALLAGVIPLALLIVATGVMLRLQKAQPVPASPQPPVAAAATPAATPPPSPAAPTSSPAPAAPVAATPPTASNTPPSKPKATMSKAVITLAIVPWGEIYVDGQKKGVSPPLRSFSVSPGKHVIEVRNANLPQHSEKIDVKAGDRIKLQHRF